MTTQRTGEVFKIINTILLTVLTLAISIGASKLDSKLNKIDDKLNNSVLISNENAIKITTHGTEAEMWKKRIEKLEEKSQADINYMKDWVEKNFQRKR